MTGTGNYPAKYLEEDINVEFLKDTQFDSKDFIIGETTRMSRGEAIPLYDDSAVRYLDDQNTINDLKQALVKEQVAEEGLATLDDFFYIRINDVLGRAKDDKIQPILNQLVRKRLGKLAQICHVRQSADVSGALTVEERELYDSMFASISEFTDTVVPKSK